MNRIGDLLQIIGRFNLKWASIVSCLRVLVCVGANVNNKFISSIRAHNTKQYAPILNDSRQRTLIHGDMKQYSITYTNTKHYVTIRTLHRKIRAYAENSSVISVSHLGKQQVGIQSNIELFACIR